jgi:hypothetical protein
MAKIPFQGTFINAMFINRNPAAEETSEELV